MTHPAGDGITAGEVRIIAGTAPSASSYAIQNILYCSICGEPNIAVSVAPSGVCSDCTADAWSYAESFGPVTLQRIVEWLQHHAPARAPARESKEKAHFIGYLPGDRDLDAAKEMLQSKWWRVDP